MSEVRVKRESIADRFATVLSTKKSEVAMIHIDQDGLPRKWTYRDIAEQALRWRQVYISKDLKRGARIAVIYPQSETLYTSYLGAVLAGFVPAMLHFPSPKLSRERYFRDITQILEQGDFSLVVCYDELQDELRQHLQTQGFPIEVLGDKSLDTGPVQSADYQKVHPKREAFLQYSSGTTGIKKAVAITHEMLLTHIDEYSDAIALTPQDCIVSWLPLYHDMGLITSYWMPLLKGVRLVTMSPFAWIRRPEMIFSAIESFSGSCCWMPNFAFQLLADLPESRLKPFDLSSLRTLVNCSEPVMTKSLSAFYEKYKAWGLKESAMSSCYAMAENTFAVSSCLGPVRSDATAASSGKPLPSCTIEIRDSSGKVLPNKEQGEIYIKSPFLFSKYEKQEASAIADDGFYASGDLGYLSDGELYVTGRAKDLIIINGRNIFPQDIEAIAHEEEGVIPGRCVAVGELDAKLGSEVLTVIAESHLEESDAKHRLRQNIIDRVARCSEIVASEVYIVPHRWLIKSSSGKLSRKANLQKCHAELQQREIDEVERIDLSQESETSQRVRKALATALAKEEQALGIYPDQSLVAAGLLDSLGLIRFQVAIEEQFQCKIPASQQTDLHVWESIDNVAKMLKKLSEEVQVESVSRIKTSLRDHKAWTFLNGERDFDSLILGSSRCLGLSPSLLKVQGFHAYNFAVNAAMVEDWYCTLRFFLENNKRPLKHIFLGFDLESFVQNFTVDIRLMKSIYLSRYLEELPEGLAKLSKSREDVFSRFSQLPEAQRRRAEEMYLDLQEQDAIGDAEEGVFDAKGELRYDGDNPVAVAFRTRQAICLEGFEDSSVFGRYSIQSHVRLRNFTALEKDRCATFKKLVNLCEEKGIQCSFFLSPMLPALHEYLCRETPYEARLKDIESLIAEMDSPNLQFYNFCSPKSFGGYEFDFKDEAHMGAFNSDKLLEMLSKNCTC
jgi:fatty-acyl-CoA synthase